jgi:(E)-4-hydroxy-3-methyl-but-2-enyl pyrophosphate reductase
MAIIQLAQHSGFCFGVKRAIQMALKASEQEVPILTVGPLIHNPQMVEELKSHGILPAENPDDIKDSLVIIRSHGIPLEQKQGLESRGNRLIDATCPYVSKAQEHIRLLCDTGYPIIILGDKEHPEVIAMHSYCPADTWIVDKPEDLPDKTWNKLGVISQTTKSLVMLQNLVQRLIPRVKELRLFNTICTATSLRQDATVNLAKKSDLMIVIGGRNSSNTRMLAALCAEVTQTLHVETAGEIDPQIVNDKGRIGLTAGASTPDNLIVEVFNKINEITGDRTTVFSVEDIPVNKEES